eukprot:93896-Chlamydomonas_euryale.AAC.4
MYTPSFVHVHTTVQTRTCNHPPTHPCNHPTVLDIWVGVDRTKTVSAMAASSTPAKQVCLCSRHLTSCPHLPLTLPPLIAAPSSCAHNAAENQHLLAPNPDPRDPHTTTTRQAQRNLHTTTPPRQSHRDPLVAAVSRLRLCERAARDGQPRRYDRGVAIIRDMPPGALRLTVGHAAVLRAAQHSAPLVLLAAAGQRDHSWAFRRELWT